MSIVAFGNSNNLTWMIGYTAVIHLGLSLEVFAIKKGKARDTPPFEHSLISTIWLSDFHFGALPSVDHAQQIKSALGHASVVLVSGEFYFFIEEFKRIARRDAQFIAVPIGFEFENYIAEYSKSVDPFRRALSESMRRGLALCDYAMFQENYTPKISEELINAGLKDRVPNCWKHLHVVRIALAKSILVGETDPHPDRIPYKELRRSIFIASRLCDDIEGSIANKGSVAAIRWIVENKKKLHKLQLGVTVIERDEYSRKIISELKVSCGPFVPVTVMRELSYPEFICALRNSALAIDSFSVSDNLRPHMTTSDAFSVGTPLVTSLGHTAIGPVIRNDARLRCVSDPSELLFSDFMHFRSFEFDSGYVASHQRYVTQHYRDLTDFGEADFISSLCCRAQVSE